MTEEDARSWIASRYGDEAVVRIARFLDLVIEENNQQNLIAPSTVPSIWSRHAVDAAQLVPLARSGSWLDIGSGGGFPGMVVALCADISMKLVEPRRKRAAFLAGSVDRLGLGRRVTVAASRVETVAAQVSTISARAVGSIENILRSAAHCATVRTRWILPRGSFVPEDMAVVRKQWSCTFHVEQSVTSAGSSIVVLEQVNKR